MGKVCNLVRPIPVPEEYDIAFCIGGDYVTDENTFLKRNTSDHFSNVFPVNQDLIKSYYSVEEKYSFLRIADYLENLLKTCIGTELNFGAIEQEYSRRKRPGWMSASKKFTYKYRLIPIISKLPIIGKRFEESARYYADIKNNYRNAEAIVDNIFEHIKNKTTN